VNYDFDALKQLVDLDAIYEVIHNLYDINQIESNQDISATQQFVCKFLKWYQTNKP